MDLSFALDIILTFRTPIVTETGHIERRMGHIAQQYLQGWFIIDLLAVLPVNYVVLAVSNATSNCDPAGSSTRLVKVLRLVRLAKLLRLAKLREVIRCGKGDLFWTHFYTKTDQFTNRKS
eukprot:COSAG06_NODE_1410_length_9546_cov_102.602519_2_plen_120_part_00